MKESHTVVCERVCVREYKPDAMDEEAEAAAIWDVEGRECMSREGVKAAFWSLTVTSRRLSSSRDRARDDMEPVWRNQSYLGKRLTSHLDCYKSR
jgi:hypothetical protein